MAATYTAAGGFVAGGTGNLVAGIVGNFVAVGTGSFVPGSAGNFVAAAVVGLAN